MKERNSFKKLQAVIMRENGIVIGSWFMHQADDSLYLQRKLKLHSPNYTSLEIYINKATTVEDSTKLFDGLGSDVVIVAPYHR